MKAPRRATSLEEMQECLSHFRSPEGLQRAQGFRPRPTDVVIAPFSKCGTTWVQQIVHGLRTRGSMEFAEITEVVPWIELAYDMGIDLEAGQKANPRAFKSHLPWDRVQKGGRYICVVRDPSDALVSMYRFFEGWYFEPGAISIDAFATGEYMARTAPRSYWHHLASWWPQRVRPDVLLLCFEEMKTDLQRSVHQIAKLMGIAVDRELEDIVIAQSSIEFMRKHETQFDDHLVREARDGACGLPGGARTSKVRAGRVGDHAHELSAEIIDGLNYIWHRDIETRFGFASYAQLRRQLA
jgi:hypothetical protein